MDSGGKPLIPDVAELTQQVVTNLEPADQRVVNILQPELGKPPNIEAILTRIRRLSQAIGSASVHGLNGSDYEQLAESICEKIGKIIATPLPKEPNPFTDLISWIGGIHRDHRS